MDRSFFSGCLHDVFMMSSCKSLDMFSYIVIYVQLCSVTVNLQSLRVEHSAASAERCFRISAAFSMGSSEGQGKTSDGNEEKLRTNHSAQPRSEVLEAIESHWPRRLLEGTEKHLGIG